MTYVFEVAVAVAVFVGLLLIVAGFCENREEKRYTRTVRDFHDYLDVLGESNNARGIR